MTNTATKIALGLGAFLILAAIILFILSIWLDPGVGDKLAATGLICGLSGFFTFIGGIIGMVD